MIRFLKRLFSRKIVFIGALLVAIFIFMGIFAPLLTSYGPYEQDLTQIMKGPSAKHLLGTDDVGRDVLTRIFYGVRTSLIIGVMAVAISAVIGVLLGLVAAFFGGFINSLISRIMDAMMSIPPLMLALALGIIFGGGTVNLMIILGISTVPTYFRMMNGQVLKVKESDYIDAARVIGASNSRIIFKHILHNCSSPIIVLITMNIGGTIIAESSLSFLGLGIDPPTASWGAMVSAGYPHMLTNPVFALVPGICIMLLVLGFNILGDGLRDVLDPKLRGTI